MFPTLDKNLNIFAPSSFFVMKSYATAVFSFGRILDFIQLSITQERTLGERLSKPSSGMTGHSSDFTSRIANLNGSFPYRLANKAFRSFERTNSSDPKLHSPDTKFCFFTRLSMLQYCARTPSITNRIFVHPFL